jgi:hypothetical protein
VIVLAKLKYAMERMIAHNEVEDLACDLHARLKALGREWYLHSIVLCLRHGGKCAYCGLDLLSSQGICYHFWCLDHLMPQAKYPELKDDRENHILACRPCNSIKGDFDPNVASPVYSGTGQLTMQQRTRLFASAKAYVCEEKARIEARFREEVELLRPFVKRQTA